MTPTYFYFGRRLRVIKSLLAGGIAHDLLRQLAKLPVAGVARYHSGSGADWSLRRSYRYERGNWYGFTSRRNVEPTGGMVLVCANNWHEPYRSLYAAPACFEVRLSPKQCRNADHAVCLSVARIILMREVQRERLYWISKLEAEASTLRDNPAFLKWIEEQEQVRGPSDYDKLTRDIAEAWYRDVRAWSVNHELATRAGKEN